MEEVTVEDDKIINLFWTRDQTAIQETSTKYGSKLHRLAVNILRNHEDAEESVSDTYLSAWNTMPPQRPTYFFAFLAKLCRFSAYGKLDWKTAQKRRAEVVELSAELETCIPDAAAQAAFDGQELGELLNTFLGTLTEEKRLIFMRRYWFEDSIRDIAMRYRIGQSKVKTSLLRTRTDLRKFLEEEGIHV